MKSTLHVMEPRMSAVCLMLALCTTVICFEWCPEPCTCNRTNIECICRFDDDVIISRQVLQAGVVSLYVRNCRKLIFPFPSGLDTLTELKLREIFISDLNDLQIQASSLWYMDNVRSIIIENVHRWDVNDVNLFFDAKSIDYLEIKNVNINTLGSSAFKHNFPTRIFNIIDSSIDTIEDSAFFLRDGRHFRLINTTVRDIEKNAVKLRNLYKVTMHSNRIGSMKTESLLFDTVRKLQVRQCEFEEIGTEVFAPNSSLEHIEIENNTFHVLEKETFLNLGVTRSLKLIDNRIYRARVDSLIPNQRFGSNGIALHLRNNFFRCDCYINWLFKDKIYEPLLNTSSCFEPKWLTGKPLFYVREFTKVHGMLTCRKSRTDSNSTSIPTSWSALISVSLFIVKYMIS